MPAELVELSIAADPDAWVAAGFDVGPDANFGVGEIGIRLVAEGKGIVGWGLIGVELGDLDGLPTQPGTTESTGHGQPHPNGAVLIDHVVVFTGNLDRTIIEFEDAGLNLRRVREPGEPGPPVRQAFFRSGEAIIEVVLNPEYDETAPARFWGVTFVVDDIAAAAVRLGDKAGDIKDAVQPGRKILTVRKEAGLGVPVALMTPDPKRA